MMPLAAVLAIPVLMRSKGSVPRPRDLRRRSAGVVDDASRSSWPRCRFPGGLDRAGLRVLAPAARFRPAAGARSWPGSGWLFTSSSGRSRRTTGPWRSSRLHLRRPSVFFSCDPGRHRRLARRRDRRHGSSSDPRSPGRHRDPASRDRPGRPAGLVASWLSRNISWSGRPTCRERSSGTSTARPGSGQAAEIAAILCFLALLCCCRASSCWCRGLLAWVAAALVVLHGLEMLWLVTPAFRANFSLTLADLLALVGAAGLGIGAAMLLGERLLDRGRFGHGAA